MVPALHEKSGTTTVLKGGQTKKGDLPIYTVGTPGPNALIILYDIFAWNKTNENVFRVCDFLASKGYYVCMPDVYRGKPWSLDNFPPPDKAEFGEWWKTVADVEDTRVDLEEIVLPYLRENGAKNFGLVGFCWGGLCTMTYSTDPKWSGCVSIHGARLKAEMFENTVVPVAIMPAKTDSDFEPFKQVLDQKPFGEKCVYQKYQSVHGFCVARGNWNEDQNREDVNSAMNNTLQFFAGCGLGRN